MPHDLPEHTPSTHPTHTSSTDGAAVEAPTTTPEPHRADRGTWGDPGSWGSGTWDDGDTSSTTTAQTAHGN